MMKIQVTNTDITTLKVDAIVNAANSSLCGGGGVDGAIHRAAGPQLLEHCRKLKGCDTGYAKLTPAFNLPAKYIIHAVGPVWYGGHRGEEGLLASCYERCLDMANEYEVTSIAFPAISCGSYRFPKDKAVSIAINTVLQSSYSGDIYFVCFDNVIFDLYSKQLKKLGYSES